MPVLAIAIRGDVRVADLCIDLAYTCFIKLKLVCCSRRCCVGYERVLAVVNNGCVLSKPHINHTFVLCCTSTTPSFYVAL